eukprot:jgi/Picre1/28241/NNA_003647.t1
MLDPGTDDKNVYCYGSGYDGQLGDGSPIGEESVLKKLTPIVGAKEFDSISVGTYHSCAISDGNAFCWGQNDYGQLGTGNNESSSTPMPCFQTWETGESCLQALDTRVQQRQMMKGNGRRYLPEKISLLALTALVEGLGGDSQKCLIVDFAYGGLLGDNGTLLCQPTANGFCEPTAPADSEVEEFSADDYYMYDIEVRYETPVPIAGTNKWSSISAGRIPCAIESETGKLYCWGYTTGEAYAEGSPQTNYPVEVNTTGTWASISSSDGGSRCGIKSDGTGWCWGRDEFDCENTCPLGDGTESNSATQSRSSIYKIGWVNPERHRQLHPQ